MKATHTDAYGIGCRRGTEAFTLTELLVVLTLVVLLLSLAGPAVIDWGRTARVRSGAAAVVASLTRARAEAMAQADTVTWRATNVAARSSWAYAMHLGADEPELLGSTNYLARGLWLGYEEGVAVTFKSDGTVLGPDLALPLWEQERGDRGLIVTVMVSRVTGHIRTVSP